jgi:hypothetical protein
VIAPVRGLYFGAWVLQLIKILLTGIVYVDRVLSIEQCSNASPIANPVKASASSRWCHCLIVDGTALEINDLMLAASM